MIDPAAAAARLAAELRLTPLPGPPLEQLAHLAYCAWWLDDREEIRARVGFEGPVSDVEEGPRADALRWLAGQGPAVERLEKAKRFSSVRL